MNEWKATARSGNTKDVLKGVDARVKQDLIQTGKAIEEFKRAQIK